MTKTESVNFNISKRYTGSSAVMQHVYCKKRKNHHYANLHSKNHKACGKDWVGPNTFVSNTLKKENHKLNKRF